MLSAVMRPVEPLGASARPSVSVSVFATSAAVPNVHSDGCLALDSRLHLSFLECSILAWRSVLNWRIALVVVRRCVLVCGFEAGIYGESILSHRFTLSSLLGQTDIK